MQGHLNDIVLHARKTFQVHMQMRFILVLSFSLYSSMNRDSYSFVYNNIASFEKMFSNCYYFSKKAKLKIMEMKRHTSSG